MKESSCCLTNLPPDITMYKNLKIVSNGRKKGIYDTCSGKMLLNYIFDSINFNYANKYQFIVFRKDTKFAICNVSDLEKL